MTLSPEPTINEHIKWVRLALQSCAAQGTAINSGRALDGLAHLDAIEAEVGRLRDAVNEIEAVTLPNGCRQDVPVEFQRLWNACIRLGEKAAFRETFQHLHRTEAALAEAKAEIESSQAAQGQLWERLQYARTEAATERRARLAAEGREQGLREALQDIAAYEVSLRAGYARTEEERLIAQIASIALQALATPQPGDGREDAEENIDNIEDARREEGERDMDWFELRD